MDKITMESLMGFFEANGQVTVMLKDGSIIKEILQELRYMPSVTEYHGIAVYMAGDNWIKMVSRDRNEYEIKLDSIEAVKEAE